MVSRGGLAWLESVRLAKLPWLVHAFGTRRGGDSPFPSTSLNWGFPDRRDQVEQNRRRFLRQIGAQNCSLATVRQVHSCHAFVVAANGTGQVEYRLPGVPSTQPTATSPPAGDALITAAAGLLLTVRTADCLPVLLVDPARRVVAAVHAGWRGALERVIEKAVGDLRLAFGSDPQQLLAVLGPSIRACCYEVGEEVVEAFHGRFATAGLFFRTVPHRPEAPTDRHVIPFLSAHPPGHAPEQVPATHLDLVAVAEHQLTSAGVTPSRISVADYCTACRTDLFFSHRKEGGRAGRQMAANGIRPGKL